MRLYVSQLPFETALSSSFLVAGSSDAAAQFDDDIEPLRILLIDHESTQCSSFSEGLREHGFCVDIANGDNATAAAPLRGDYALILLNSMRPGPAGVSAVQSIRRKTDAPLLVLTERDDVASRMAGLEFGASDYRFSRSGAGCLSGRPARPDPRGRVNLPRQPCRIFLNETFLTGAPIGIHQTDP
ncbi:response regulator [Variovorax sp. RB3P1]|uniref:response regulator n=1 Tax=Variovorax sp. RB3P1 TaxID=3443732 RepID=UPI003F471359